MLMGILEKLNSSLIITYSPPQEHPRSDTPTHSGFPSTTSRKKIAVVDGMAEVQSLVKPRRNATLPELCKNTSFVIGTGQRHRRINLEPIFQALGPIKAAAIPTFHAFSGADITGSFSGKGKIACWKAFIEAEKDILTAFVQL